MERIYLYEGAFRRGDEGWPLIRAAAARYGAEAGLPWDLARAEIRRDDRGKPRFVDVPVAFSLSHTGAMWMCLFSPHPCGLDVQRVKDCRYREIARRFYTEEEARYAAHRGLQGFFDIWVRKEAFGKCTGTGLSETMPSMVSGDALLSRLQVDGQTYYFTEIAMSPDLPCVACTTEKSEIEVRIIT